ncbi:hypothetical protein HX017_14065 [Myroides marinus]|uniref:DUF7000 domain-containing protein n=1 Tax=Myroides marinus TaxID=703342 RepID=A0A1H6V7R0_9FLAO|nr:hypothetical protein [Myroides marinus]MDM1348300.1 hypothetical protein [Myroides marinus]MDM1351792.1 hypothetical protein [Myroides marinus]MDM1355382.1 hypothetical protein [Myroides marinus]MDM1359020.1 hypothetical protein [Myroides marinus]MDM1366074.1 hypothetical protein [Myroides marinus]
MENLNKYVSIYKEQLQKGDILIAYNELVKFTMRLRTDLIKSLSNQYSFAGILHGYMDFTYFYYSNDFLKGKKLKFGVVLNHVEMRFEVWLLGNTIPIQEKYWELSKNSKWNKDKTEMPKYSILEAVLVTNPDFNNLDVLSKEIEEKMIIVSDEIIEYLKTLD